jgi:hypothetical protein
MKGRKSRPTVKLRSQGTDARAEDVNTQHNTYSEKKSLYTFCFVTGICNRDGTKDEIAI